MMVSFLTMRSERCWTGLQAFILAALFLTMSADDFDSECTPYVEVRRNTWYNVSAGEKLRIKCPVTFCNNTPPNVFWAKMNGTLKFNISNKNNFITEWEMLEQNKGVLYLIFRNILDEDTGDYQCGSIGSVSHFIRVHVLDRDENSSFTNNPTLKGDSNQMDEHTNNLIIYICCSAGIILSVITVIIVTIKAMKCCKEKSKRKAQREAHYIGIRMVEQPVHDHITPRGSPSLPPPRRSRKSPSNRSEECRLTRNDEFYDQINKDRNKQSPAKESGIVYAALNHELPQRSPGQRARAEVEPSEYAAIRVG